MSDIAKTSKPEQTPFKEKLEDYPKGAQKLISEAERLFGQFGIDNVSLRQIVAAAGQANNYAVQHHFGSKEGLIEVIFRLRMSVLDAARAEFLAEIKASGDNSVETLIKAIMLPILNAFDEKQRYLYADFTFQLFHRHKMRPDNIESGDIPAYSAYAPAVTELNIRLRQHFADLPSGVFITRYRLAAEVFLSGLYERKRLAVSKFESYPSDNLFWDDMASLAIAIFKTPYPAKKL